MELRETILEGTIQAFNKNGLKFTMEYRRPAWNQ